MIMVNTWTDNAIATTADAFPSSGLQRIVKLSESVGGGGGIYETGGPSLILIF